MYIMLFYFIIAFDNKLNEILKKMSLKLKLTHYDNLLAATCGEDDERVISNLPKFPTANKIYGKLRKQ